MLTLVIYVGPQQVFLRIPGRMATGEGILVDRHLFSTRSFLAAWDISRYNTAFPITSAEFDRGHTASAKKPADPVQAAAKNPQTQVAQHQEI
jgi:hypothetical protein